MPDLQALEAAKETAFLAYNSLARSLPRCCHVQAWEQEVKQARAVHLDALRAYEEAAEQPPAPAPAAMPEPVPVLEAVPAEALTLFDVEAA